MNVNLLQLVAVFLAGALLGLFYFVGLWFTLRSIHTVRQPGLLLLFSYVVRVAVVMLAFYFIMAGDWKRIIVCLVGFLVMRYFMIRKIQPVDVVQSTKERISS